MATKKREYEKPSMQVFELKQQSIICSSPGQTGVQDYDWNTPEEE